MIHVTNLKKEIGTRTLFEIEELTINSKGRIGLIGDNGVGKTTFFNILIGKDTDYSGFVDVQVPVASLLIEERPSHIESSYSPGEYQRVRISQILAHEAAFLLIDEPTSHLDIKQKDLLVAQLKNRRLGYLLISHDRDFINQTCDTIFELINGKLEVYNGDYTVYLAERVKRRIFAQREYEAYISEKKRLSNVAQDIKSQSAKIRTTPKRMGNSEARLHKMGGQSNKKKLDKQVKAIESRIEHLEVKEKPKDDVPIELTMDEKDKIFSKILVSAEDLTKCMGDGNKRLFDHAHVEIKNNRKYALIGDNGSGKTTLLNMILNRELWVHPNVKIGYYSQLGEIIDVDKTILDNVLEDSIYEQTITRIVLAQLGFTQEDVFKRVTVLSDGERAKVKLAKLLTADFNFLVLDEPTNYLDIRAIEALETLLKGYDRPLLFVTHDVSFINHIADGLLIIDQQKINHFDGNLEQYKQSKARVKRHSNDLLLDFRLTAINNRLAADISKEERTALLFEYDQLMKQRANKP
ncbi:ABC-F family ATP-binding cassette domain-containing protein [Tuanshanicoccus lijuaniae]|uniref:ribosomal protection-like ABC-F family protein n=1 Tax=Aerococcaceae bacterium zg-1292 TaxID=2774330 RepID=UPI001935EE32|nr:ABC-F family ATP-binding cassette domain-containing protein [Aerococcaceae bacterium zg-1292]QQA36483.1 ABC-F family ATP-binding cassette domain-containing protein [Aerococcaceae bacterium zg-1292]